MCAADLTVTGWNLTSTSDLSLRLRGSNTTYVLPALSFAVTSFTVRLPLAIPPLDVGRAMNASIWVNGLVSGELVGAVEMTSAPLMVDSVRGCAVTRGNGTGSCVGGQVATVNGSGFTSTGALSVDGATGAACASVSPTQMRCPLPYVVRQDSSWSSARLLSGGAASNSLAQAVQYIPTVRKPHSTSPPVTGVLRSCC